MKARTTTVTSGSQRCINIMLETSNTPL
jgi:hypothetical protein